MSIVAFVFLAFCMLFSIYNLFARPLNVYQEYLRSLPETTQDLSRSTYLWVMGVVLTLTTVSTLGFSLWALVSHIGYTWAAMVGLCSSIIRVTWFIRESQLRISIIGWEIHIEFNGAWRYKGAEPYPASEKINFIATAVSCLYLAYLVVIVFLTR